MASRYSQYSRYTPASQQGKTNTVLELYVPERDDNLPVFFQIPAVSIPLKAPASAASRISAPVCLKQTHQFQTPVQHQDSSSRPKISMLQMQLLGQDPQQNPISHKDKKAQRNIHAKFSDLKVGGGSEIPTTPSESEQKHSNRTDSEQLSILQASLREIHSYSVPFEFENIAEPSTADIYRLDSTNQTIPRGKATVNVELTNHVHQKGKSWILNTNRSPGKIVQGCNLGWEGQPSSEIVKQLDRTSGSALEQLLLSDIGCPPNMRVVQEHFNSDCKTHSCDSTGFNLVGISSNQSHCLTTNPSPSAAAQRKKISRPGKHRSPVIMEKRNQRKKFARCRSTQAKKRAQNHVKQRPDNLAEIQQNCKQKSHKFEVAMQVLPSAEYGFPLTKENLDLAESLCIDASNLTVDNVMKRKGTIQTKVMQCSAMMPVFTLEEEFDVSCRAEAYVESIVPDPDYYIAGGIPLQNLIPADSKENFRLPGSQIGGIAGKTQPVRKRRRHLSVIDSYMTMNPYSRYYPELANCVTLSDGCQLLKPPFKLVELVAQAINDSPDGMLQVQQVYNCIQRRYPFFQYLDRTSMTSWRSSIRHALYQKWFRKIQFDVDNFNCKGCYWAINRRNRPKEWAMPQCKDSDCQSEPEIPPFNEEFLTFGDLQRFSTIEMVEIEDETLSSRSSTNEALLENPLVSMECLSPTPKIADCVSTRVSKDPDPMMNQPVTNLDDDDLEYISSSSSEHHQSDSDDSMPSPLNIAEENVDTADAFHFDWKSASDDGSYDSGVAWIPSFEDDDNAQNTLDNDDILIFNNLPDLEDLEPEQMSMCLQKNLPYDEHW